MFKPFNFYQKTGMVFLILWQTSILFGWPNNFIYAQNTPLQSNPQNSSAGVVDAPNMGQFDFSIPIYTIELGDISIPISIRYTGGDGIKTRDIATDVGLGWNLNLGGYVLSVPAGVGNKDYQSSNLFHFATPTFMGKYFLERLIPKIAGATFNTQAAQTEFGKIKAAFNTDSHLGSMPTLETSANIFEKIIISDKDRNIFKFIPEKSIAKNSQYVEFELGDISSKIPRFDCYATDWLPKEFSNLDGLVVYNYDTLYTGHAVSLNPTINRYVGGTGDYPLFSYADVNEVSFYNEQLRIKSIDFPLGKIKFIYDSKSRADYLGSFSLKKVIVENMKGNIIKVVKLGYRYLIGTNSFNEDSVVIDQYDNNFNLYDPVYDQFRQSTFRRLILNSVSVQDESGNNMDLGYRFDYNNTYGLPSRLEAWSYDDYWGYYNGRSKEIQMVGDSIFFSNNSAHGDEVKGQEGMLSSVAFPGGSVRQHYFQRLYGRFLYPGNFKSDIIGGYIYAGYQDFDPVTSTKNNRVTYRYYQGVSVMKPVFFERFSVNTPKDADPRNANSCTDYQNYASLSSNVSFPLSGFLGPSYCFDSIEAISSNGGHTTYFYTNYDLNAVNQFISDNYIFNPNGDKRRWAYKNHGFYNGYFQTPWNDWPEPNLDEAIMAVFANNSKIGKIKSINKYDDTNNGGVVSRSEFFEGYNFDSIGYYTRNYYEEGFSLCQNVRNLQKISYTVFGPTSQVYALGNTTEIRKGVSFSSTTSTDYYPKTTDVPLAISQNSSNYTFNVTTPEFNYQTIETIGAELTTNGFKIKRGTYYDRDLNTLRIKNILTLRLDSGLLLPSPSFKFATSLLGDNRPPSEVSLTSNPTSEELERNNNWLFPHPDARYDTSVSFRWDSDYIRVIEKKVKGQSKETYLYGYSTGPYGKLLVAKIVGNVSYEHALSLIDQSVLNNAIKYSDAIIRTELQKLRNGLPGAFVETYTYKPLVGLTSITDPRGRTLYYEYDNFNRLTITKDHEGNLLTKKCYSEYGNEINCITGAVVN